MIAKITVSTGFYLKKCFSSIINGMYCTKSVSSQHIAIMKTMPLFSYVDLEDKHEVYPTSVRNLP